MTATGTLMPPEQRKHNSKSKLGRSLTAVGVVVALLATFFVPYNTVAQDDTTPIDTTTQISDNILAPTPPAPASGLTAVDKPNDDGTAIIVNWELSPSDDGNGAVSGYTIYRATSADGEFTVVGDAVRGATKFTDSKAEFGGTFFYRVDCFTKIIGDDGTAGKLASASTVVGPASPVAQWFNWSRGWCLLFVLFVCGAIIFYIMKATKGDEIYVRKIAGIDAVDEAVGRATEMGRKIFFIPGIQDMNDVQTIAGIAILGRVAQMAAQYETWLEVPVSKSLVMVTARETMKEAYTQVGKPDLFREAQVHYITDDQFGYAAAIDGMVVREKPATIFYMGAFFAESLILAETGNAAGAIQIAGTAMPSQLPFFVAACDYTLIGEELFAASAYLSREPRQLGSLKGQDMGKALFIIAIIIGVFLTMTGLYDLSKIFTVR